jgi:quercetin dioxygenase-like cupin family protein
MQGPSVADYPRGARMGPRVIDDCEFVWMLRGQALFVTEGEEWPLSPGHLLLVPPGVRRSFCGTGDAPAGTGTSTSALSKWAGGMSCRSDCVG